MNRFTTGLIGSYLRQSLLGMFYSINRFQPQIILVNQRRLLANDAAKKNFYETLGVSTTANDSEIKKAYLKVC